MRPSHRFTIPFFIAWSLFVVSFFLKAANDMEGWRCAGACAGLFWNIIRGMYDGWGDVYYALFTICNVLMLFSPLAVYWAAKRNLAITAAVTSTLSALYVISLAVLIGASDDLKWGYFIWMASFVVFAGEWLRVRLVPSLLARTSP